jgi:hypothetical protein
LAALLNVQAFAADPVPSPDEATVQQALRELDHSEWIVRERATHALSRSGPAIVRAVSQRAANGSPEAAVRAIEVLAQFYDDPQFAAVDELETALEPLLVARGAPGEAARRAWESQRIAREQRAVGHIQALGGSIQFQASERLGLDLDEPIAGIPQINYIVIGRRWKGGDEGLKHITRLSQVRIIYRVKDAPITPAGVQKLDDAGFRSEVRGAFLGISGSQPFGGVEEGCMIDMVTPKSPAEKAGLQPGDIVLKFDDKPVKDFNDLIDLLKAAEPNQKVTLTIQRGGQQLPLPVELGNW